MPRLDSSSGVEDLPAGVAGAVEAVRAHYQDREAPKVRMLPHDVNRDDVVRVARDAGQLSKARIAIGINEEELAPVILDFDSQPHLVAFADTECGKTGLLRNIAAGVMENATPVEAKIILVDFRRSMLGVVPDEYLGGYATAPQSCTDLMTALAGALKDRLPPTTSPSSSSRNGRGGRGRICS